jgi:hypothetical protein
MSDEPAAPTNRTVDSLANIYAVVIGLALTQAVVTLMGGVGGTEPDFNRARMMQGLPAFVALLFTLVPFWHGMNRHLDRCYISKTSPVIHWPVLLDFGAFFVEAILLFAAAWSLRKGLVTYYCLGLLLAVDMIWGIISHRIHFRGGKSHVLDWSKINVVAAVVAIPMIIWFPSASKAWGLMIVAVGRTIVDYVRGKEFYFPR